MGRKKVLISSDEAVQAKKQHTEPCSDCPMARKSLNGWLGGALPHEYRALAHSDLSVSCHTLKGAHCAGMAIYRSNVCKRADFTLPKNTETVFATPAEFMEHHTKLPTDNKD